MGEGETVVVDGVGFIVEKLYWFKEFCFFWGISYLLNTYSILLMRRDSLYFKLH